MKRAKSKFLFAAIESVYGQDAMPTAAANAILVKKVKLSPMEGEEVGREIETVQLGASEQIPVGLHAKIEFEVDWLASGTLGLPPAYGVLMRACAMAEVITAETTVEYLPVSEGQESLTLYTGIDNQRQRITGARGTFKAGIGAKGLPVLIFTFWGRYAEPTNVVPQGPNIAAQLAQKPKPGSTLNTPVFTLGGATLALSQFEYDAGLDVQPRILIGYETILITDRQDSVSLTVDAVDLSVFNPYARAANATPTAVNLVHGTVPGQIIEFDAARLQLRRPTGITEDQNVVQWPLSAMCIPQAGDDQVAFTFR